MSFDLGWILNLCLILFVIALVMVCIYVILLLVEFIRSMKSVNRLVESTEGEVNSMVKDISQTVNLTTSGIQDVVKRIGFLTSFLEVLGVVSTGVGAIRGKAQKTGGPSKIAVISALAGLKRGLDVLLSEKKDKQE